MKKCSKCDGEAVGKKGVCKSCWAAYMRDYYARNPDKAKAGRERKKVTGQKRAADRRYHERYPGRVYAKKRASEAKKPEHYKAVKKAWYEANKAKVTAQCKAARERRMVADPEGERRKRAEYAARRRREDPQYLIYGRMSALVRQHLKKQKRDAKSKAGRRWTELVGYTVDELVAHLMATVPDGYTWDDYLSGKLEVDHIIPDCDFCYQSVDDPGFRACWALTNLRLLTQQENSARRYK